MVVLRVVENHIVACFFSFSVDLGTGTALLCLSLWVFVCSSAVSRAGGSFFPVLKLLSLVNLILFSQQAGIALLHQPAQLASRSKSMEI